MFADEHRASWQNPRILTTLLLVFLTGGVCGALAMQVWLHGVLHSGSQPVLPGTSLSYSRLKTELNLTPKQADAVRLILDDSVKYHIDLQNQYEDLRATGKNRILAVLNADQQRLFKQLCEPPR